MDGLTQIIERAGEGNLLQVEDYMSRENLVAAEEPAAE
jgi:hypothetical protein